VREAEEWITKYVPSEKWLDSCLGCWLMYWLCLWNWIWNNNAVYVI
jgi:hypothetical protein